MRAGAAGLRASGSRCDLRSRAALPLCRLAFRGARGSAPSAPLLNEEMLANGRRMRRERSSPRFKRPRRLRRLGEGHQALEERGRLLAGLRICDP